MAKANQGPFAERSLIRVQTIEHQLPATIHEGRFDHLIIRDACVRLQDGRQGQLGWSNGGLSSLACSVEIRQFVLKPFIQQFVSLLSEKHK